MRCDWCNGPRSAKRLQTVDGWAAICETCYRRSTKRPKPARNNRRKSNKDYRQTWFDFMSLIENGPTAVNELSSRKEGEL